MMERNISFYTNLIGDFSNKLILPCDFVKHFSGTVEIPGSDVKLINPNGVCWVVKIEEDEDGFAFKRGWDEFIRGNLLEFGDYLVFTYSGWFRFEVKLYDHKSSFGKELALLTNVDESNKEKIGDIVHVVSSSRESSGSSVRVMVSMDNDEGESRDNGQCSRMSGRCRNSVLKEMTNQTGQDDSRAKKTRKSDVFVQAESDSWQQMHDINGIVKQTEEGSKPTFCSMVNNVGQLNSSLVAAIRRGDWYANETNRLKESVMQNIECEISKRMEVVVESRKKVEDELLLKDQELIVVKASHECTIARAAKLEACIKKSKVEFEEEK
ncbi:hypothetical protein GIB67_003519, partial [Kingdonia uniflora]